ncbi:hypothetical protein T12_2345 [Trichinella patagoniensis]|uniref:Uncharacterized protein n=1 Tax=Trichinella patagoniensis TaxID=990121 RepID=A0A0V0ZG32_9BILA|nr:hypothetical protein T12_2345 [Trichinella patagoniensis]
MDSKAICLLMAFSVLFSKSTSGFVWELYKAKNSTDIQNYEIISKSAFGLIIPIVVYCKTLCKRLCKSCHHEDEETLLDFVDEAFLYVELKRNRMLLNGVYKHLLKQET